MANEKFDLYRYFARSFLLPLFGLIFISAMAITYPPKAWHFELGSMKVEGLIIPAFLDLCCIGIFNGSQVLEALGRRKITK